MAAPKTALVVNGADGSFKRSKSKFMGHAEDVVCVAGRYHLYIALACPWANGALTMLNLKGLRGAIGVSVVHPTWSKTKPGDEDDTHCGWVFRAPGDAPMTNSAGHASIVCDEACVPDTVEGCQTIRELYALAGELEGPFSTPVLWDSETKTIVSNESMEILPILNSKFDAIAENSDVDLFPSVFAPELEQLNDKIIYNGINNGVYRCGFAKTQAAYESAAADLATALAFCEDRLGKVRFLTGDTFTWLDLRLFHTLYRFDPVYVVYFKTNSKRLSEFPNLLGYVRDIYSMEAVKSSLNLKHIKSHYFTSHPSLNLYGIIPVGNHSADLTVAHGRERLLLDGKPRLL